MSNPPAVYMVELCQRRYEVLAVPGDDGYHVRHALTTDTRHEAEALARVLELAVECGGDPHECERIVREGAQAR